MDKRKTDSHTDEYWHGTRTASIISNVGFSFNGAPHFHYPVWKLKMLKEYPDPKCETTNDLLLFEVWFAKYFLISYLCKTISVRKLLIETRSVTLL